MSGRAPTILLWLVAVLGLALGGYGVLMWQGASQADTVTTAQLTASVNQAATRMDALTARVDSLTGLRGGSTPIVNAAMLNGLTSDQLVRGDVVETGHFNCQGIGLWPWSSETKYTQTKLGRVVTSGEGFFDCLVNLPNGATITALRGFVHDLSPTEQAVCYMLVAAINRTATGNNPAYTESSGDAATPGDTIIEDLSIEPAVVDNANFSYLVECWLSGPGNLALKGASIEYTVSGRPIP